MCSCACVSVCACLCASHTIVQDEIEDIPNKKHCTQNGNHQITPQLSGANQPFFFFWSDQPDGCPKPRFRLESVWERKNGKT